MMSRRVSIALQFIFGRLIPRWEAGDVRTARWEDRLLLLSCDVVGWGKFSRMGGREGGRGGDCFRGDAEGLGDRLA